MKETEGEESKKEDPLFRPTAVEYYSGQSQFEHHFQPIYYKKSIIHLTLLLLLTGGLFWFFFGSIPIEAEGVGIIVNVEGLSNVETSFSGIVKSLNVQIGEMVKQGDLLAVLHDPQIETQLQATLLTIKSLQKRLDILRHQVEQERILEKEALTKNIQAEELKIDVLTKEIPTLQRDVHNKEDLAERGLLHSSSLQESKELLWAKQDELENTRANLSHLQFLFKKGYRQEEIAELNKQLLAALQDKSLLETKLHYQNIYSPVSGIVLEWLTRPGQYVAIGDSIARLEIQHQDNHDKILYGYLPVEIGRKIRINAEVTIELSSINTQEYGAILGNISNVSNYAISPESLTRLIDNPALINHFLQKHPAVIQVIIQPQRDPTTKSGYRWTSGEGPPIQLSSGTLCTFKGLVEEVPPYLYILPIWWFKSIKTQN